jgi:glycine cleavage system H protein
MTSHKKCHLVPPDEQRCIWMSAGVLSYQLCDRMLECETCPLDHALRRRMPAADTSRHVSAETRQPAPAPEGLRTGLRYSRNHCWIRRVAGGRIRIGVEPGISSVLLAPKTVVLPAANQSLRAGQTCLWIVAEGGTFPLESPVDGVVSGTNRSLAAKPHLVRDEPFGQGWLFEVEPETAVELNPDLLEPAQVNRMYDSDQNRLMTLLSAAAGGKRPDVGITMADGGRVLQNIANILGPTRYFNLVRQVFAA